MLLLNVTFSVVINLEYGGVHEIKFCNTEYITKGIE